MRTRAYLLTCFIDVSDGEQARNIDSRPIVGSQCDDVIKIDDNDGYDAPSMILQQSSANFVFDLIQNKSIFLTDFLGCCCCCCCLDAC